MGAILVRTEKRAEEIEILLKELKDSLFDRAVIAAAQHWRSGELSACLSALLGQLKTDCGRSVINEKIVEMLLEDVYERAENAVEGFVEIAGSSLSAWCVANVSIKKHLPHAAAVCGAATALFFADNAVIVADGIKQVFAYDKVSYDVQRCVVTVGKHQFCVADMEARMLGRLMNIVK